MLGSDSGGSGIKAIEGKGKGISHSKLEEIFLLLRQKWGGRRNLD